MEILKIENEMNYELTNICTNSISKYLKFDVKNIFDKGDYIAIFGGAVRDSLAIKEIHDIDIICLPESAINIAKYLESEKFIKVDLYDRLQLDMYKELKFITEPWTFIKDTKIIQIIKPVGGMCGKCRNVPTVGSLIDAYYSLLSDVDISACGVFIEKDRDDIIKLKESHPNAITHCRSNIFEVLKNNRMFGTNRTNMRALKLESRNWKNISDGDNLKEERKLKLLGLPTGIQKPAYQYRSYKRTEKAADSDLLSYLFK